MLQVTLIQLDLPFGASTSSGNCSSPGCKPFPRKFDKSNSSITSIDTSKTKIQNCEVYRRKNLNEPETF